MSDPNPGDGHDRSVADADKTARARIRDAAIRRFARDGVAATSLKAIAADAGVSPPLVVHHFGSKAGLREAVAERMATRYGYRVQPEQVVGIDSTVHSMRVALGTPDLSTARGIQCMERARHKPGARFLYVCHPVGDDGGRNHGAARFAEPSSTVDTRYLSRRASMLIKHEPSSKQGLDNIGIRGRS